MFTFRFAPYTVFKNIHLKKIILKALQNNNALFLFSYYNLATRVINIKNKAIL